MTSKDELQAFFQQAFPHSVLVIEEVKEGSAIIRKPIGQADLRPGNTVSGPTLMAIADAALYAAILGTIGLQALAVTTNLNINFLRKPSPENDIVAKCILIKLGKALAVGEVFIYSDGLPDPVAHAIGTYSIPPN